MLTRRGWLLAASSLLFALGGRLFGLPELYLLAAAALVLTGAALAYVRLRRPRMEAARVVHPPRVHAGGASRVDLSVTNVGTATTPVVTVRDPFDRGWRWARFLLAPLRPGASDRAAYRLPTDERGVFDIGPLEVQVSDPFGLASASLVVAGVTQLTVYPRIDTIRPLAATHGTDPHAGAEHPLGTATAAQDFHALRPYVVGDDLRRVHWASTARTDELMIRQDELPWQTRVTILLDVRERVHTEAGFELAVSAAASILDSCRRQRALVRVVTTDGTDSGFAEGQAHIDAVLEHLAAVDVVGSDKLAASIAALRRAGNGGSLAVITTADAATADLDGIARLKGRYGAVVLVLFERSSWDPSPAAAALPVRTAPATDTLVRVTAEAPFASAWDAALAARARSRR